MQPKQDARQLAQSASALGAAILGFGLGIKWGGVIKNYALWVIIIGAFIHIYGMYVMQMKKHSVSVKGISKALWISAWVCLVGLLVIIVYLLLRDS
jgi:hypothetical protein